LQDCKRKTARKANFPGRGGEKTGQSAGEKRERLQTEGKSCWFTAKN
jgi:hypothetical protein